ncbi:MAG: (d)CMP kinase [Fimbriimonadales bacterium]
MKVIAIDGPAGSGKSTLAKRVAKALGFVYLDTGAMYRALALKAHRHQLDPDDEQALSELAQSTRIEFVLENDEQKVLLDGEDVSQAIRLPLISDWASRVSVHSGVRRAMVQMQKAIAQQVNGLVAEGRDTTTVVFPNALLKIYLTASPEERARRRWEQLKDQGVEQPYEAVLAEIIERDRRDTTRADSPLKQAEDAVVVQNDGWTKEQTLEHVLRLCRERLGEQSEGRA